MGEPAIPTAFQKIGLGIWDAFIWLDLFGAAAAHAIVKLAFLYTSKKL